MVYVVGHKNPDTDSVCSAIVFAYLLNKWKKKHGLIKLDEDAVPAIQGEPNPETKHVLEKFNTGTPEIMTNADGKKIILVDHSEKSQAPRNIDKAEIIAIIDHHKIGDITTPNPILFVNLPVGSTGTILKLLFDWTNVEILKEFAGLMLSSILSDTVIFKSATTTETDIKLAKELAKIAGIDNIQNFGIEIKSKLSNISGLSAKEIIARDFKEFDMSGSKLGIGQIEIVDLELVKDRIDELINELKEMKEERDYSGIYFMITDIMKEGTLLLVVADDENIVKKAFGKKLENNRVWLDRVMSRKKQVVPPLENAYASNF